jgi:hypothetical protein
MFFPLCSGHDHVGCTFRHTADIVEYTLPAMQAEYWGYTGIYIVPGGHFRTSFLLHNTPLIVALIALPVFLLFCLLTLIVLCCCCSKSTTKQKLR